MTIHPRQLMLAVAVLAAVVGGVGLARLTGGQDAASFATRHTGVDAREDQGDAEPAKDEAGIVALTAQQIKAAGIQVAAVGRGGGSGIRLNGRVEPAIGARASVAAAISGRVEKVIVAPGTPVGAGAPLAVIVSGEAASMHADAEAARAEAEAARLARDRDQALVTEGVVAQQELEASRARSLAADAAARAASARVAAAGSPDAAGRVTVTSPVTGVVGTVQVTPGAFVSAGDSVANVTDPALTELVFSAPPTVASEVVPGMRINVIAPGVSLSAVIIGAAADVQARGGMAIIRARPEHGSLPPAGSPVSGIVVAASDDSTLTVPADAVQTVAGRTVVFVADAAGFRAVPVLAGRRAGRQIEILDGLSGDERVAASNAFLLKAQLAKGEAAHGH